MSYLVAVLAALVAGQYVVIAIGVLPRLARLSTVRRSVKTWAQWGATAFFLGCALTHVGIAVQSVHPAAFGGAMGMAAQGGGLGMFAVMVVPHVAQILGGGLFIAIAGRRLEVSITSKEQASELRELEAQWRAAFEDAPVGIGLLTPPGTTTGPGYVNPAYREMFGADPAGPPPAVEEILGRIHPADRAAALAAVATVRAGQAVDLTFRVTGEAQSDRPERWVHCRLNPVTGSDGARRVTAITEDITDRVRAETESRQSEERFAQLAGSVAVGINLRQLRPPRFLYANAAYNDIVGFDPTVDIQPPIEPDADPALTVIHPDDLDRVLTRYWAPAQAGQAAESEHRVLRRDGQIRWVRATSNPVHNADGTVTRVAGTVEDITARKAGEAAVRAAQREAERANTAKSEFLSRMSHELRTPMNAVLGFGQLLQLDADTLTPSQQQAVEQVLRGGQHLLALIDDLLDLSRIDTDQLPVTLESVHATDLLRQVVTLMKPTADAAGITVRVATATPTGPRTPHIHADRRRLHQVLLNLLSNAIKYNNPGGTVTVATGTHPDGRTAITIADTGIGIRAEDLPRLFTPFDRLDQHATNIDGAGIGLALTKRLVDLMGGDLDVRSTHGHGTTFTITLPPAHTPPTGSPPPTTCASDAAESARGNATVLYIEDNSSNTELMTRVIGRRPHWSLLHADTAAHGLALARTHTPDLILLDLHLPDMHGIDVLHALHANPPTADIPVIIVTADANPTEITRLRAAGAHQYRTKPLNVTEILHDLDHYTPARAPHHPGFGTRR